MFKSRKATGGTIGGKSGLQSKIAHTTIIPALGNRDLKLLQDLITAEKSVVSSLLRLSTDYGKAAEALRIWGQGEGDDLGDILAHSCGMLLHFSAALTQYATHEQSIRSHLKNIRSREENLDEIKKKRKSVGSKADSAERKLSKMNQENKSIHEQTDLLTRLREEMRYLDTEIMNEEARLGDFKRQTSKDFLALKFGGLLESAEKATVAGELGLLLIEEIPLDTTMPGHPRTYYSGYDKTSRLASEASRCVSDVTFKPPTSIPGPPAGHRSSIAEILGSGPPSPKHSTHQQIRTFSGYPPPSEAYMGQHGSTVNEFGESVGSPRGSTFPDRSTPHFQPPVSSYSHPTDDGSRSGGGQFSTFPVRGPRREIQDSEHFLGQHGSQALPSNYASDQSYTLDSRSQRADPNFTDTIADALAADSYLRQSTDSRDEPPKFEPGLNPLPESKSANLWNPTPHTEKPSLPSQPSRHVRTGDDPQDESALPYAGGPTPAGRGRRGSLEFNYPYEDNAYFVRNHATSSVPINAADMELPVRLMQEPDASVAIPPQPSPAAHREEEKAAANAAASREVGRELDVLAFQAMDRGSSLTLPASHPQINGIENPPPTYSPSPGPPSSSIVRSAPSGSPHQTPQATIPSIQTNPISIQIPPIQTQTFVPSNAPPLPSPTIFSAPRPRPNAATASGSPITPSGPVGARMISAAAFRRPAPRSPVNPDGYDDEECDLAAPPSLSNPNPPRPTTPTTPLQMRKRGGAPPLGSRSFSANSVSDRGSAPSHALRVVNDDPPEDNRQHLQQQQAPSGTRGEALLGLIPDEEEFMRELEKDVYSQRSNGPPPMPRNASGRGAGYESGRFSTNLE